MRRLSSAQRLAKYGDPRTKKSAGSIEFLKLKVLNPITGHRGPVSIAVHNQVEERFKLAFDDACITAKYVPTEMQGLNVRKIRGGKSWSLHSWALAWDCFGPGNILDPITGRSIPPEEWFEVWESHGFTWGGRWKTPDPHHIEWPL